MKPSAVVMALFLFCVSIGSSVAGQAPLDFENLKGKWVRQDGGYVIEIKSVDQKGQLEAGYFNPNPIHVAKAQASWKEGSIEVFVELRDVNYPGSNYTLSYDPERDRLSGVYYQAVEGQRYEIFFKRML